MTSTASADVEDVVLAACRRAVPAQRALAAASAQQRDAALRALADALEARAEEVLAANAIDLGRAGFAGVSAAQLGRLALDAPRVAALAAAARAGASLPDPVGTVEPGLRSEPAPGAARRVRVPVGVVAVVHEGRPEDLLDAAVLGVRCGCAVLLRGVTAARQTSLLLVELVGVALASAGLPVDAVQSLDASTREAVGHLARSRGLVDLLVPRGGAAMVRKIVADASVPVALDPDPGTPRAYVGALGSSDDVDLAVELATRSWSVLLQRDAVEQVLPVMLSALDDAGIGVWADAAVIAADGGHDLSEAGPEDFSGHSSAGSSSRVVVGIVADADAALDHLRAHPGTGTEAVVTADAAAAARFAAAAPADVVLVNALGAGEVRAPWSTATLTRWRWVVTDPADGEGT